jgi:predicted ester cyclase
MATLTDDCVYELVQSGHRWETHEGATRFYVELLTAFPDIDFALTSIVVGPQGVCEEAVVNGTFSAPWLGLEPNGEKMVWRNVIFFPWDPEARLFTGERVYSFFPNLPQGSMPIG